MRTYELVDSIEKILHCDDPRKVIAGEHGMATAIAEYTGVGRDYMGEPMRGKAHRNKILIELAEYITYNKVSMKVSVDSMVNLISRKYKVGHESFLRNVGIGTAISTDTYNCIEDNYGSYTTSYRYTTDLLKNLNL